MIRKSGYRFSEKIMLKSKSSIAPLCLCAQFGAVELFFHLVEGVVADLLELAHPQQRLSCRADGAAAQRIGRQLAAHDAEFGFGFGAQQHGAVLEPQDLGLLGRIGLDRPERGAIGDAAGLSGLARDRIVLIEFQRKDHRPQRQALDHERPQHHGKGRQQDEIAVRETLGQREGGRQRNDTAHPAPRYDDAAFHRRYRGDTYAGSRPCAFKARSKAPYVITQAMRAKTTTAKIVAAKLQYLNRTSSSSSDQIGLSCMPIIMNASTLSTNTTVSHTA